MIELRNELIDFLGNAEMLIYLTKYSYVEQIFRHSKLSYSTINKKFVRLEELDLVSKMKKGRINYFILTDKGNKILNQLVIINNMLINDKETKTSPLSYNKNEEV